MMMMEKGNNERGKLIKGILYDHNSNLIRETKEKEAFGSCDLRFKNKIGNKLNPGPGSYDQKNNLIWNHDSISSKGYGPLISNQKRFHLYFTNTPGPGKYNINLKNNTKSIKFNTKINDKTEIGLRPGPGPGPGYYNYDKGYDNRGYEKNWNCNGSCSSFKTTTERKIFEILNKEIPSPTTYYKLKDWKIKDDPSSTFKKSLGHKQININNNPGLGPGSYDITYNQKLNNKNSSMFYLPSKNSLKCNKDLSNSLHETNLGPGCYNNEIKSNNLINKNKMSSFISNVPKLGYLNEKNEEYLLGPGQYDLNDFKIKKSFHLNAKKRFVS